MNLTSLVSFLFIYGLFLIAGGAIGYFNGGSVISFFMGGLFGVLSIISAVFTGQGKRWGGYLATAVSGLMSIVFIFRLIKAPKLFPAGIMLVLSVVVFSCLLIYRKIWAPGTPVKKA